MIASLIDRALILESLSASDKASALHQTVSALAEAGSLPANQVAAIETLLHEREELGTTGIGNGVAVPHVKTPVVSDVALVLARLPDGVDYAAIDGRPVHTLFLLMRPLEAAEEHLEALRWVSTLARNPDFRRFVLAARDESAIRELLHEMNGQA